MPFVTTNRASKSADGYIRRMARAGARSSLPSVAALNDVLTDSNGNSLMWMEYDTSETSLTKRIGMPVGLLATDRTKITGDFSASRREDYQGILTAVPDATNKYVLVAIPGNDFTKLTALLGTTVTAVTDSFTESGDQLCWGGDDLFRTNAFGTEGDFCHLFALADDSSTSLTSAVVKNESFRVQPTTEVFSMAANNFDALTGSQVTLAGDSGTYIAQPAVGGGKSLTTGTNANDQITIHTAKNFTAAAGRRQAFYLRVSIAEAATDEAGVFIGFSTVTGAIDAIADTTGALAAAAALGQAAGFYVIKDSLFWKAVKGNASANETGTGANIAALVSGTVYELRCWVVTDSTNTVAYFSVDGAAYVSRSQAIGTPSAMNFSANVKNIPGTTSENMIVRDLRIGQDI